MRSFSELLLKVDECRAQIKILKEQPRIDPALMFTSKHTGLVIPHVYLLPPDEIELVFKILNKNTASGQRWITNQSGGALLAHTEFIDEVNRATGQFEL